MSPAMSDRPAAGPWEVGGPAPSPPPLRPEPSVLASWDGDRPLVSVLCSTYQHRGFIEDALRGFVGQRTTFPFEVIVRDDASTDGTAEIVADFADRYPNIVRAILEPVNRWREREVRLSSLARGEYIARCEGDDYWIDPTKLQTQVETLTRNVDAVVSHHQALIIEDGRVVAPCKLPEVNCRDLTRDELVRGKWALTLSLLYRKVERDEHPQRSQILNVDRFLLAQLGEHGGAKWEPDLLPAVYRRHPGGVWSAQDLAQRHIDHARSFYWIGQYFADRDPAVAEVHLAEGLRNYLRGCREAGIATARLLVRNDRLVREAMELEHEDRPRSLRRLIEERDAAVGERDAAVGERDAAIAARDRLKRRVTRLRERSASLTQQRDLVRERHDRMRQRLSVRIALRLAPLTRPLLVMRDRWRRLRPGRRGR